MKHRLRFVHWFCLVAYTWAATCMGENLVIHSFVAEHPGASIVFEATPNQTLVVHHAGHRDAHEPNAVDNDEHNAIATANSVHGHADHVLNLGCTQLSATLITKDFKPGKLSAGLPTATSLIVKPAALGTMPLYTDPPPTPNSRIAFVRITQLRL